MQSGLGAEHGVELGMVQPAALVAIQPAEEPRPAPAAGGQLRLKLIGRGGVGWGVGAGQEADQSSPSPLHEARRRLRASSDCTRPSSAPASWPRAGAGRGQTQRPSLQPSPHVAGQEPGLPAARGPGSSPTIVRRHMRSEMRSGLLMKRRFVPQYHTPRPRDRPSNCRSSESESTGPGDAALGPLAAFCVLRRGGGLAGVGVFHGGSWANANAAAGNRGVHRVYSGTNTGASPWASRALMATALGHSRDNAA